jgi:hypothetical protein
MPTDFLLFESGAGGDYATYVGQSTGSLYRVDLAQVNYLGKALPELLSPVHEREGGPHRLRSIPEQVQCKMCGNSFSVGSIAVDGEELVTAFLVA